MKIIGFTNARKAPVSDFEKIQTRSYRAPEVILKLLYDYPVDLWSYGCMLFEMITGQDLF